MTAVPRKLRVVGRSVAAGLVAAFAVIAVLLKETTSGAVSFRTADQAAMVLLGLLLAGGVLLVTRPKVTAGAEGVRVQNILSGHTLPWAAVRAVRFDDSAQWASLLLADGDELPMLAVQAADGERAVDAVVGLRALLNASRQAPGPA